MTRTRSVRLVALVLMLAGAATWVMLTAALPAVDAAAGALFDDPRYGAQVDPGDGELQIALFDARTAALLLVAAGVAAFAAPHVRSGAAAGAVALTALGVTLPVGALLTRAGTSSSTAAAVCGGVLLVTAAVVLTVIRRRVLRSVGQHSADEPAGRALLVSAGLLLVASMPALALQVPERAWVRAEMPAAFTVGYTGVEVALVLGGLALVAVTVPKPDAVVVAAVAAGVTLGGWVATAPTALHHSLWALSAVTGGLIGASTVLAVTGLRTGDGEAASWRRVLAAGAAAAVGYVALMVPSFLLAMSLGLGLLTMSGGELGADGLPLLFGGTIAGLAAVAAYGWAQGTSRGKSFVADDPRVTPA